MPETTRPMGFNVVGHLSSESGLGVASRSTVARMVAAGYPVAIVDVPAGSGDVGRDSSYAERRLGPHAPLPYAVTVFHLNPIELRVLLNRRPAWFAGGDTLNVCVPFWELERVPVPWEPVLAGMDAVLAPTSFIAAAVRAALPSMRIIELPQSITLPDGITADRARFGIPEGALVCFSAFNTGSGTARKNPQGAIEAFKRALPDLGEAVLVVKMMVTKTPDNPLAARRYVQALADVRRSIEETPHVIVIDETLAYRDVLSLYASSDVLIALHRSEGLGLHLMEAMALGRAVVATGWSGNMEFMTNENSIPIGYELVPVSSTPGVEQSYSAGFVGSDLRWAEPHVDEAAAALRRLAADPGARIALGARARSDMERLNRSAAESPAFSELEALWREESVRPDFKSRESALLLGRHWRHSISLATKTAIKRLLNRG